MRIAERINREQKSKFASLIGILISGNFCLFTIKPYIVNYFIISIIKTKDTGVFLQLNLINLNVSIDERNLTIKIQLFLKLATK